MAASDHLQGVLFGPEVGGQPQTATQRIKARAPGTPQHEGAFSVRSSWENRGHTAFASKADTPSTTNDQHLKMFMTAHEITSRYQALDGDREEVEGYSYTRTDQKTWEPGSTGYGNTTGGREYRRAVRPMSGGKYGYVGRQRIQPDPYDHNQESDDELFDRKYEEASMSRSEYADMHGNEFNQRYQSPGGGTHGSDSAGRYKYRDTAGNTRADSRGNPQSGRYVGPSGNTNSNSGTYHAHEESWQPFEEKPDYSLAEHIEAHGVTEPVRLGQQFGSMGKPQIAGGHHRIAVMRQDNPHGLMPVIHDESIQGARDTHRRLRTGVSAFGGIRYKQGFADYGKYT